MFFKLKGRYRPVYFLLAAMILGYGAWVVPPILIPGNEELRWPLLPTIMTDSYKVRFYMVISLSILGAALGFLDPARGMLWGAMSGVPIMLASFIEGALGLVRHNLWGVEVLVYAVFTLPAILGGGIGSYISRLIYRLK